MFALEYVKWKKAFYVVAIRRRNLMDSSSSSSSNSDDEWELAVSSGRKRMCRLRILYYKEIVHFRSIANIPSP